MVLGSERKYGSCPSRQHHADSRNPQHGRTGRVRDPQRSGEHRLTRRSFLSGAAPWPCRCARGRLPPRRCHARRRASTSITTAAHSAPNTCRRPWAPAAHSSTTTPTAGWTFSSSTAGLARAQAPAQHAASLPQQSQRHVHRRHRAAGLAVEMYAMGVAVGDYDNDGFPDLFVTAVGQNRLFRNTGKGRFVDVTAKAGTGRPLGLQHVGDVVRLRPRRAAGSVRLQLCAVVRAARRVLQRGRQEQIVLHARGISRLNLLAVPQPRQRHVRRCHRQKRHLRHQFEIARRRA